MRAAWILTLVIGCGAEAMDGDPDEPIDRGDLRIVSFAADASDVSPCGLTWLSWEVRGAEVVNVSMGRETLVSSLNGSGMVISRAICEDTVFELKARTGSTVKTASVAVTPRWSTPEIVSFTNLVPDPVVGQPLMFHWEAMGAARVTLERDGQTVASHVLTTEEIRFAGPASGIFGTQAQTPTTTFSLIAQNSAGNVRQDLSIYADDVRINRFGVHPPGGTGPTLVSIDWDTFSQSTELWVDGVKRNDAPTTSFGSIQLQLTPPVELELRAIGVTTVESSRRTFSLPAPENEPNDAAPVPIMGGAIQGSMSDGDTDRFLLSGLRTNQQLNIYVTDLTGQACATFSATLGMTDPSGNDIAYGSGYCTSLFAVIPADGDYTLRLTDDFSESGDYLMFLETF